MRKINWTQKALRIPTKQKTEQNFFFSCTANPKFRANKLKAFCFAFSHCDDVQPSSSALPLKFQLFITATLETFIYLFIFISVIMQWNSWTSLQQPVFLRVFFELILRLNGILPGKRINRRNTEWKVKHCRKFVSIKQCWNLYENLSTFLSRILILLIKYWLDGRGLCLQCKLTKRKFRQTCAENNEQTKISVSIVNENFLPLPRTE